MKITTAIRKMTKTDDQMAVALIRIQLLEAQLALLVKASKQVLSDVDDDGVAERNDMGVLALREAVKLSPANQMNDVITCARRVCEKFGADSDWSEWSDLRDAIVDLDQWPLTA